VVAEAPNKVLIRLPGPSALFEPTVAGRVPIIPKHIWSTVTDPAKFLDKAAVIGSGPYKLESYDRAGAAYLYVANDEYFLGKPYVRRLEFVPWVSRTSRRPSPTRSSTRSRGASTAR
jgi:peptide/nickel transport system substrate-binding protein